MRPLLIMGVLQKSLSPLAPYPVPMLLPLYFLPASKLGKAGGKVKDQVERPRYTITGTEIFDGLVSFAIVCCDVNSYGLILPDVYALIHVTDIVFCVTFPSSDADILP